MRELAFERERSLVDDLLGAEVVSPLLAVAADERAIKSGGLAEDARPSSLAGAPIVDEPLVSELIAEYERTVGARAGVW